MKRLPIAGIIWILLFAGVVEWIARTGIPDDPCSPPIAQADAARCNKLFSDMERFR